MSEMRNELTTKLQIMLDHQAQKLNKLISEQGTRSGDNANQTLEEGVWNFECSKPPHTTKMCHIFNEWRPMQLELQFYLWTVTK